MAHTKRKISVYSAKNKFVDQNIEDVLTFPEIDVKMKEIETLKLLMHSKEDNVLITIFRSLTEFIQKRNANIEELKQHNIFDALLKLSFYIDHPNVMVRRFALYLGDAIVEYQEILQELSTERLTEIVSLCKNYYVQETDDFCLEYLSVIINNCMDDPHIATLILNETEYLEKFFTITASLPNPDTIYHSLETIHKMLQVQKFEDMQQFASTPIFPIDRALCELVNEFPEIRTAALKVISGLVLDCSEEGLFKLTYRARMLLQRLTQMICEVLSPSEAQETVDVLSLALRSERMVTMYFQLDLFEKLVHYLANQQDIEIEQICMITSVFTEMSLCAQYQQRIHEAGITNWFIGCLLKETPAPGKHILEGLLRLMKYADASKSIVEAYEIGLLEKLISIITNPDVKIKIREKSSKLVNALLLYSFHPTAQPLLDLGYADILAQIFSLPILEVSVDFVIVLLQSIEELAKYDLYRSILCKNVELIRNMASFLWNSFSAAILVTNMIRCLCILVDEEEARLVLLDNHITASIKHALQSISNLVKTAATNFILQTARFPEYIEKYINIHGVIEVLISNQKHSFCVPTWNPAIEAILSKKPTFKFAYRNSLSFTDTTSSGDFIASKMKFSNFLIFQEVIHSECSPLFPMLIVNFNRKEALPEHVIHIPKEVLDGPERHLNPDGWFYVRYPPDEHLPKYLERLNEELSKAGLLENPEKMKRCIDFENMAKRIKIVALLVAEYMGNDLKVLDLNSPEECMRHAVDCHLKELRLEYHCSIIPLGRIRTGCQFERAILFKALADQIGLPSTLQRSVDGKILFNEVPLPVHIDTDVHCDLDTLKYMSWRMLRPTHVVDLLYNVGDIYAMQSRQALQYLRLF